ncbi:MAG: type II toxin-antitoxin system HicA family toxin [Oscillatoriales cyanobacterium RU_3_3]|nr:type II toxin-antitoxin system HicA family toxin [Microcoleus sp. SU_5_6]NJL66745.1 type II toxin-antitoxin system HicA family toxin [Microcoleus sp. SM1_3_4]NJM62650.1 type II toxin-antitoxin system HicA family toxin [Oscillatoriales cyanobacterium RU_3_3]NJR22172.1 type II toxin-antitoxin system HicA family toxin [Richelia sp. CSU_2_1]NJS41947.1 type II toxin-antitoxin system HicA family toxin [Candidatus Gracilibacteria bacterium]
MPVFGPIARRDLIAAFRAAGFEGPFSGGKHQFMQQNGLRVRIPNPHQQDISRNLLGRILMQANISQEEWENL